MGNPRNRARKPSRKRKATRCHSVDEKVTKITIEETQQSDDAAVVRPKMSLNAETPLSTANTERESSSSRKLPKRIEDYAEDVEQVEGDGFVIFCMAIMRNIFSVVCCPGCKQEGVELQEISERKQGVAVTFKLMCSTCLWEHQFSSSRYANVPGKKAKNNLEVNVRLIMAFRNLGIGYDAQWAKMVILQTFVDISRELNVTGAVGSSF